MGIGFLIVFPLTFVASTFVPIAGLPAGLQQFAEWNPISSLAAAVREQFGNPTAIPAGDVSWPLAHPARLRAALVRRDPRRRRAAHDPRLPQAHLRLTRYRLSRSRTTLPIASNPSRSRIGADMWPALTASRGTPRATVASQRAWTSDV